MPPVPAVSSTTGTVRRNLLRENHTKLIDASALNVSAAPARARSTVAKAAVPAAELLAEAVTAKCRDGQGSAHLARAVIAGKRLDASPPPNTTIPVDVEGLGRTSLTLNKQQRMADGRLAVTAVELRLPLPGKPATVRIASATCGDSAPMERPKEAPPRPRSSTTFRSPADPALPDLLRGGPAGAPSGPSPRQPASDFSKWTIAPSRWTRSAILNSSVNARISCSPRPCSARGAASHPPLGFDTHHGGAVHAAPVDNLDDASRLVHPRTDLVLGSVGRVLDDVRARLPQSERDIGTDLGGDPEPAERGIERVPHQRSALGVPRQGHFKNDLHAIRLRSL